MTAEQTEGLMRAWAAGSYPDEAGVELLIRAKLFEQRDLMSAWHQGSLDIDALEAELTELSGQERRLAAVALSLLSGGGRAPDGAVDLPEVLDGLDRGSLDLVLAALAHAAGSHQHRELLYDAAGSFTGLRPAPPLHPWPEPGTSPTP